MASAATDLLIGKIASALEYEASLLGNVRDQLEELKLELESMKSFLDDADRKKAQTQIEKNWVASVRDLTYEVEDIIDEFMYHMNQQHSGGRFSKFLHQIFRFPKKLCMMHQMATKLQKINKAIKDIPDRNQRYGGPSSNDAHQELPERESSFYPKEVPVGIEDESRLLKQLLMDTEPHQTVISVVGMGGSGKTTLVAEIYNDESVKRHFDCYAWITVSQTYARDELFRNLIKEFYQARKEVVPVDLNAIGYKQLLEMLVNYLKQKTYLVVMDDVWDINLWEKVKQSLPDSQLGSRIILTTRSEDVASHSFGIPSHSLPIRPLVEDKAWTLFCMKAFSSYPNKACPRELEPLARELVDKCEGLPLAIATLGGLMHSKKSMTEWSKVCSNLNWQLSNNEKLARVKSILLLSFDELPYPLKRCFLYCCLFPEDYCIRRKRLIRLWIAEGFVQHGNRIALEEVAEHYLKELISRNMLQVVRRNEAGRPKACKMHDLMRELALSISESEKFCAVYDGRLAIEECKARRLSIQTLDGDLESYSGMSQLRSFLVFLYDSLSFPNTLLSKFKLLRVLDLEDVPVDKLPDELGILFNLRYLNLKRTWVAELPKSIGRLRNLEILDIRDTRITELPIGVAKLQNLKHLIMYRYSPGDGNAFRYVSGTRAPFKISKLKKLQVMSFVEAEGDIIRQLGSMTQLTRIGIGNLREADKMDLCSSIMKLKQLHYLFLMVTNQDEFLQIDSLSSPPPQLRVLILAGKLERVPRWFCSLYCLTSLYLHWSRLTEDLLPHIAALPCLGGLTLVNAFVGEKLHFCDGFAKLTRLHLQNFPQLIEIVVGKGVMPEIQQLYLDSCMELNSLPQGIEYLTNLQELTLSSVSMHLIENIRGGKSVDRLKVQHIPKIHHYYRTQYGFFYESLS